MGDFNSAGRAAADRDAAPAGPDRGPLRIRVTGHPGVGARTLAAALRRVFGVDAVGPEAPAERPDDLCCQVLGAAVRGCDLEFLDAVRTPVLVVAGKADLRGGPERAAVLAAAAARRLQRPVYPVAALPGGARVTAEDLTVLRGWRQQAVVLPPLIGAFLQVPEAAEAELRSRLLTRFGPAGLARLLAACDDEPALTPESATTLVRDLGGLAALAAPIRAFAPDIQRARLRRWRADVQAAAAAGGPDRDRLESLLQTGGLR